MAIKATLPARPPLPPGKDKHHIVVLEAIHCKMPEFDFPHTIDSHLRTSPSQVAERIKDATIVIACVVPVTPKDMDQAPYLGCLGVMAVGISWVDKEDCARRGVTVTNCAGGNVEAVSQHFLGLYFAARKKVVQIHNAVTGTQEWVSTGTLTKKWSGGPPMECKQEVLGIMGYGTLGKRIESLARALGFGQVLISERKGVARPRAGRLTFDEVLRRASTLGICVPMEKDTVDLIDEKELKTMRPDAIVINVARGGIVNEAALAKALREGWIAGAATDVLGTEPAAPGMNPLLPNRAKGEAEVPNLTVCKFCQLIRGRFADGHDSFAPCLVHCRHDRELPETSQRGYRGMGQWRVG